MQILRAWAGSAHGPVAVLGLFLAGPAGAVRVPDVYAESVPTADATTAGESAAFGEALRRVLVKVTGRESAATDPALFAQFGDPQRLVQQFRRDTAGMLWAQFDPAAVRNGLQAAGWPVWGEERPLTVAWVAYDTGNGERDLLAGTGPEQGAPAALREELLRTARARGVPLVLPLGDSRQMAAVTYADVWGEFTEPLRAASAPYGADAILVGRVRLFPPGLADARWTLLVGEDRMEWRGGIADGPQGLAERLAQRLAVGHGSSGGTVRLAVAGIGNMDQYGAVLAGLQGLEAVAACAVTSLDAGGVVFDLVLRADRAQFARGLALLRLIEPEVEEGAAPADATTLRYRVAQRP